MEFITSAISCHPVASAISCTLSVFPFYRSVQGQKKGHLPRERACTCPLPLGTPLPACMVTLSAFRHVRIVEGICTHCFIPQLTDLDHTFLSKHSPTRKSAVNLSALDHENNGDTPKHFQEFHINLAFHLPEFLVITKKVCPVYRETIAALYGFLIPFLGGEYTGWRVFLCRKTHVRRRER